MKKKLVFLVLVLAIVLSCAGCGKGNSFTVTELEAALNKEDDFGSFKISESSEGVSFSASKEDVFVSGTADKKQKVLSIKFENAGVDTSAFKSEEAVYAWCNNALTRDVMEMTWRELNQMIATMNCITELSTLYSLAGEGETWLQFVATALANGGTSEIKDWDIKTTIDDSSSKVVIEAVYLK